MTYDAQKPIVVELRHNRTNEVLFSHVCEDNTVKITVEAAVNRGISLDYVDLTRADLSGANLEHLRAHYATLNSVNLSGADLRNADLYDTSAKYAKFDSADLYRADFMNCDLNYASLTGATLRQADMRYCNLRNADLRNANAHRANFGDSFLLYASLDGMNLEGAEMWSTVGDGTYIKSLQIGGYEVAYTATHMQIGCKNFAIQKWFAFDDDKIEQLDGADAVLWWAKNKEMLRAVIAANPAQPTKLDF